MFCAKCYTFKSFEEKLWTFCKCNQMVARWVDPGAGTVEVLAEVPARAFIIGMHNGFLRAAIENPDRRDNEFWRGAHDLATLAPDYLFDDKRRRCWAVIIRPGFSSDVSWHHGQSKLNEGGVKIGDIIDK